MRSYGRERRKYGYTLQKNDKKVPRVFNVPKATVIQTTRNCFIPAKNKMQNLFAHRSKSNLFTHLTYVHIIVWKSISLCLVFIAVLLQPELGKKMQKEFHRTGQLKDITSYPTWLQDVVAATTPEKNRVVQHEFFALMRDGKIELPRVRQFLIGAWKTIEGFPQFMALNLQKVHFGYSKGEDMARRYLIQNIRVEQKHADHWAEWARAADVTVDDLNAGRHSFETQTLAHWCWYISSQPSLAVGIAATNFAVEGATGEWSCLVCSKDDYEQSLPEKYRKSAMRWLRLHAEYDDIHPWEALDIIATLLGHEPSHADVDAITEAVRASYIYMALGLDESMAAR